MLYNPRSLWIDVVDPAVIQIDWLIDGVRAANVQGERFDLGQLVPLGVGMYEITAIAEDPTEWVRIRRDELRQETTWKVTLNPGDLDNDYQITVADINRLTAAALAPTPDPSGDLNFDGLVDQQDRRIWVHNLAHTSFGDANLDGEFDSADMVHVFQAGQYEDFIGKNSTWATGDWDGNYEFETGDIVLAFQDGGFQRGSRATRYTVPEPSSLFLVLLSLIVRYASRRPGRAETVGTSTIFRGCMTW